MTASQIKIELFREIDNLDKSTLNNLYNFLVKSHRSDFWKDLNEWQKADIEAGLNDLKKGKRKDFKKVIAKY